MRLLLTRPTADSLRLAERLQAEHIDSLISPVLEIVPQTVLVDHLSADAVFLSSRHALAQQRLDALTHLPAYTVGEATAEAARLAGFAQVQQAGETVEDAANHLKHLPQGIRLLYLRGDDISRNLTALLPQALITEVITYQAKPVGSLAGDAIAALQDGRLNGVVFYSSRSASLFMTYASGLPLEQLTAFCLSAGIAEVLDKGMWHSVIAAPIPETKSLINAIKEMKSAASLL